MPTDTQKASIFGGGYAPAAEGVSSGLSPSLTCSSSNSAPLSILVLISGSGTNLQALIDAFNTPSSLHYPLARITHVISNKKSAFGLERARKAGIGTTYHNLLPYKKRFGASAGDGDVGGHCDNGNHCNSSSSIPSTTTTATVNKSKMQLAREAYDADLAKIVLEKISPRPDLVVCAGWMHILSSAFLSPLKSVVPIINLHPALPGQFDGANAIQRAWEAFQKGELQGGKTGVMIHYVVEEVDRGQPVLVREVECRVGESLEGLEERMHVVEWEAIVEGTRMVVEGIRKEGEGLGSV